jgi:uncharacterized protein YkwD
VWAVTLRKEATFYSDNFDWGQTANGDIFHQTDFSAAICDIPLGRLLYVSKWGTGVVVKANDRPNCARYPDVIDFSLGRVADVQVTDIGTTSFEQAKWFVSKTSFSHLGITLTSSLPNILFVGQGIEIQGRVNSPAEYVILSIEHIDDPMMKDNRLIHVEKDGRFKTYVLLPEKEGEYIFVIARGKSFATESYVTLNLIDPDRLIYPTLPQEKYKIIPRVLYRNGVSSITLPANVFGELTLKSATHIFQAQGTSIILRNTWLEAGPAQAFLQGYTLSTSSPLDRRTQVRSFFSGSVILDRKHESIRADAVKVMMQNNIANIRFNTPHNILLRPRYYLTLPSWKVDEYTFAPEHIGKDKYLKNNITINLKIPLMESGNSILEFVWQDGTAYLNIPLSRGNVWSIIDPLSEDQIKTIQKNKNIVQSAILEAINRIRKKVKISPVTMDHTLSILAQAKVDDMIARNYQSHIDPDGKYIDALSTKLWLKIEGGLWENIWYGNISDIALQDGLEESGVHRHNMLQSVWKHVGIGYGTKGDTVYLVHVFGE